MLADSRARAGGEIANRKQVNLIENYSDIIFQAARAKQFGRAVVE